MTADPDLFEAVLGPRYRTLPRAQQATVLAAVGQDDCWACPLALAYGIAATGLWANLGTHGQHPLHACGVTPAAYEAFLAWHDRADGPALAPLRAWLQAQMEVSHGL